MPRTAKIAAVVVCLSLTGACASMPEKTAKPPATRSTLPANLARPDDVYAAVAKSAKQAESVRVVGQWTVGKNAFKVSIRTTAANHATGKIKLGNDVVEVRRLGKVIYLKAPQTYWQQAAIQGVTPKSLADRWVKVSQRPSTATSSLASAFASTSQSLYTEQLVGAIGDDLFLLPNTGTGSKVQVNLSNTRPGQESPSTRKLAVNVSGLPVKLSIGTDKAQFTEFSEWNRPVTVKAPGQAVNLDQYL